MAQRLLLLTLCIPLFAAPVSAQERGTFPYTEEPCPAPILPCDCPEPWDDRFDIRLEYLHWYLKRLPVPPLLTTGPPDSAGILGEPGTVILRGGEPLESRHNRYIGVRGRIEWWLPETWGLPDEHTIGLQTDFFFLERDSSYFTIDHGTYSVLAVPYVDAATGQARSYIVAGNDPNRGNLTGGAVVYSRMELFGQEANVLINLMRGRVWEVNLIGGARFFQFRERLNLTNTSYGPPDGSTLYGLEDKIQTFNKFYGAQLGFETRARFDRWLLEGKATGALGGTDETVRTIGERVTHTPTHRSVAPYGLFVLPSNTGRHSRWDFDAAAEFRINFGYELTRHIGLFVGYTFLLWDGPVRPGDQVQPVDLSQINNPGSNQQPEVPFRDGFFWAQGLNVGGHLRW